MCPEGETNLKNRTASTMRQSQKISDEN